MAKRTVNAEPTAKVEEKPVLYPEGGEVTFIMPNTNSLGKLKTAKKGVNLTSKYMTVEDWEKIIDKPLRCFYLGLKSAVDGRGDQFHIARLIDDKGNPFVSAPTILVQSLANLRTGQGVEITCTKIEKNNSGGRTPYFEVVKLEFNLFGEQEPEFNDPAE